MENRLKKEFISVFKPEIARKLLRKQYKIIDIKPFKEDLTRTFFVFKNEGNFEKDLAYYINETK